MIHVNRSTNGRQVEHSRMPRRATIAPIPGSPGERIRDLRIQRGLSQTALAKLCKIKQPSMSLIESGDTKQLQGPTLYWLCQALETTGDYIFGRAARPARVYSLTHDERELLDIMRTLPESEQAKLIDYARWIRDRNPSIPSAADPFPVKTEKTA